MTDRDRVIAEMERQGKPRKRIGVKSLLGLLTAMAPGDLFCLACLEPEYSCECEPDDREDQP